MCADVEIEEKPKEPKENDLSAKQPKTPAYFQVLPKTPGDDEFKKKFEEQQKAGKRGYYLKLFKFISMLVLVVIFLIAELVGGIIGNSLALISDAFHMTSDSISHAIGLIAVILSAKRKNKTLSYGWARAEVLGAMINSVFLLSVVYFIYVESLKRFIQPEEVREPMMILIVGFCGLLVNVLGLIIFGVNEEGGGGDGPLIHLDDHQECCYLVYEKERMEKEKQLNVDDPEEEKKKKKGIFRIVKSLFCGKMSQNVRGVFLHVFGDFLGSIGVMVISILLLIFKNDLKVDDNGKCRSHCWLLYLDPGISALIATIILCTTSGLFYQTVRILMQSVPQGVKVKNVEASIKKIDGVEDLHQLHIWNLVGERYVCTMHVTMENPRQFNKIANQIKILLHENDIHSSTIQPEFVRADFRNTHLLTDGGSIQVKDDDFIKNKLKKKKHVTFRLDVKAKVEEKIEAVLNELLGSTDEDIKDLDVDDIVKMLERSKERVSKIVNRRKEKIIEDEKRKEEEEIRKREEEEEKKRKEEEGKKEEKKKQEIGEKKSEEENEVEENNKVDVPEIDVAIQGGKKE